MRPATLFTTVLAAAALAGCASLTTHSGPPIPAPEFRAGDQWVYRVKTGFGNPLIYDETWTVTSASAQGTDLRVVAKGGWLDTERRELWPAPGLVSQGALFEVETRRFATPLERYRYPLTVGERWNQRVVNYNEDLRRDGPISRYVRVIGYETVTVPAGTFEALRLEVLMQLDDGERWRWPTDCLYTVWYAPAVKGVVKENRRATYVERRSDETNGLLPAQNATVELLRFSAGG